MKQILLGLLFVTLVLSQTFPPIDPNGGLHITWQNLMIDDTKLASLMTTFRSTYNPSQVKYLNLFLDGNRLTTLNGLSPLTDYKSVIEF